MLSSALPRAPGKSLPVLFTFPENSGENILQPWTRKHHHKRATAAHGTSWWTTQKRWPPSGLWRHCRYPPAGSVIDPWQNPVML